MQIGGKEEVNIPKMVSIRDIMTRLDGIANRPDPKEVKIK